MRASTISRARRSTGLRTSASLPRVSNAGAFQAADYSHPDLRRWTPLAGSPDADLLPDLGAMRSRSRDITRNHGVASGAQQTIVDNVLGCGLWLAPMPDYVLLKKDRAWASEWRRNVKAHWRSWAETKFCDAGRSLTLDGLATQIFTGSWLNGDGVALPLWMPESGAPCATRIQVIESDRLCNPQFTLDTATLRGGVEIDAYGAAVAFHVRKAHPGDRYWLQGVMDVNAWERIPATTAWGRPRVIHVHDKGRAGQSRGVPALAAVMRQFKVLGDYQNAELKAAVVNAMVAMVTESSIGQDGLVELLSGNADALSTYQAGLADRNRSAIDFNGGMVVPLALGEKIGGFTPARPTTAYEPFVTTIFRHVATGLNIPYELLMKDFSKTNYSSARASLLEATRFFVGRRNWLGLGFYQPCYELFLEEMINAGKIEAPGFYENKAAWCRARWIGPGRGWVDPVKEAEGAGIRMDLNISTLEDECAEQGKDWEEVLEQRAEEEKRFKELGLERVIIKAPALNAVKNASAEDGTQGDRGDASPAQSMTVSPVFHAHVNFPADAIRVEVAPSPVSVSVAPADIHVHEKEVTVTNHIETPEPVVTVNNIPVPATKQTITRDSAGEMSEIVTVPLTLNS